MLRADNVCCGTSSTGTGTLSLAACPTPPGGIDFFQWLTATGYNFVNGNALIVDYTINEYTDSSLATLKQTEKGVGTLTLGANLAASSLARTVVQATGPTGLAPLFVSPTAINVGTAANTLIFVGASALDILTFPPYIEPSNSDYAVPLYGINNNNSPNNSPVSGRDEYWPFVWPYARLVKTIRFECSNAYSGTSDMWARLYLPLPTGKPGKLLVDFGHIGTAGSSFGSSLADITGSAAAAFFLAPGVYFLNVLSILSGGAFGGNGTGLYSTTAIVNPGLLSCDSGHAQLFGFSPFNLGTATGGTGTVADPANVTGWAVLNGAGQSFPAMCMKPT